MIEIKDRIIELRLSKGMTQGELAKELGLSPSSIGMYEQGRRKPSFELLEKISDYFNVDMDYLMGRSEIKNKYQLELENNSIIPDSNNLCDITLPDGKSFEFKENNGKIKMLMKEPNKSEWKEFQFDDYEQREFEKVMGMNMLFFNGKEVAPEDKIELEKTLLTIFIKAYFNHKK